jgi:zinc transport system permease protein
MKIVGILLVTAMLIIPAAGARRLAISPLSMAMGAVIIGIVATIGGIGASLFFDTPSGPSIVLVASLIFVASLLHKP